MNATNIEWVRNPDGSPGYTLNPASGCENHTPEGLCLGGLFPCYAYKLAHGRLKGRYLQNLNIALPHENPQEAFANPFYPRFWEERLAEPIEQPTPMRPAKRKGIFVCDMGDLFGIGIPESWTEQVMTTVKLCPYHRFYLLTKQPQNLIKWSPFPDNCFVGVTVTGDTMMQPAYEALDCIIAKVKYISLEPYLSPLSEANIKLLAGAEYYRWLDLLIIGACTGTWVDMANLCLRYGQLTLALWGKKWTAQPPIEWLQEIVSAADKAGIKVFLKNNLAPLLKYPIEYRWAFTEDRGSYHVRQEMPE